MHHRPSPWARAEQPPAAWSAEALWIWAFVATLPAPKRSDFLPRECAGGIGLATRHLSPRSLQFAARGCLDESACCEWLLLSGGHSEPLCDRSWAPLLSGPRRQGYPAQAR